MLVLTARDGDGGIHLTNEKTGEFLGTIFAAEDRQVRLAFEFPRHISIVRDSAIVKEAPHDDN
jgi:sRNA-binding carbon storage regulator CsrA